MHQGNWKCSKCGGVINELPFIPRSESGLTCRTCYAKSKSPNGASAGNSSYNEAPADTSAFGNSTIDDRSDVPDFHDLDGGSAEPMTDDGFASFGAAPVEKPRTEGNWSCATCGAAITSLPFTPRDVTSLKCIDCFKRSKA